MRGKPLDTAHESVSDVTKSTSSIGPSTSGLVPSGDDAAYMDSGDAAV